MEVAARGVGREKLRGLLTDGQLVEGDGEAGEAAEEEEEEREHGQSHLWQRRGDGSVSGGREGGLAERDVMCLFC